MGSEGKIKKASAKIDKLTKTARRAKQEPILSVLAGTGEKVYPSGRKNDHLGPSPVLANDTEAGGLPSTPGGDGRPHRNLALATRLL